jgi:hypothetical protein
MKHLLHKISLVLMAMFFLPLISWGQTATKPSGNGTAEDPYRIETLENLHWLSKTDSVWNDHFIQIADIDASPTSGWDNDSGFLPISHGNAFKGYYNGKGHKIEGLYINRPNKWYLGLFSIIFDEIKIDSIRLEDLNIIGTDMYGGGIAGKSNGTINHCSATGSISGNETIGGLVGNNYGTIKNSYSTCTVDANGSLNYAGGLVGINDGTLENSYSTGSVNGNQYVGGLAGGSSDKILNCYSKGNVNGDSIVGGLVGYNYKATITNSYSTGIVTGNKKTGGLVGLVEPTTNTTNSYWDTETSGIATSAEGAGRTTAEMQNDTTYTNNTWDFVCEDANGTENIWARLDGMNDGYPIIAWQYEGPVPTQATLPDITGQGSAEVTETPTAEGICGDEIDGTTDDPLTYENEGTYTITWTYEDSQGNITTQEQTVVVQAPDGINELEKAGINIYPNPVESKMNIQSTGEQVKRVVVTDLSGRVCLRKKADSQSEVLNLSTLNSGIYLIQLETEKGKYTAKIVKK